MSCQPGCVIERGTRFRAHTCNRCLLTQAVCESRPAAVRLRFTGSVAPARARTSACCTQTTCAGARPGTYTSSWSSRLLECRSRSTGRVSLSRPSEHKRCVARWVRSWPSWVREMQDAWTCWSYEVFSRKGAFPPPQFLRKGAQWFVFIDPYLHWAAYRHSETWWSEESAVFFHRHFRQIVRSIGTQGHQSMGKMYGVGE